MRHKHSKKRLNKPESTEPHDHEGRYFEQLAENDPTKLFRLRVKKLYGIIPANPLDSIGILQHEENKEVIERHRTEGVPASVIRRHLENVRNNGRSPERG